MSTDKKGFFNPDKLAFCLVQVNHISPAIRSLTMRLELSDHGNPVWDCTFQYFIRPRVYTKNAFDTPNIKLVRNQEGYIEGFDILVNNTSIPDGEREQDKLSNWLKKILIVKSGMRVDAWPLGYECKDKITGGTHTVGAMPLRWSKHGWVEVLDLNNQNIQNFLNSDTNPNLENLSNAISSQYEGRFQDSIKTAFKIIEPYKSTPDYWKFNCIRNVLTHEVLEQAVITNFIHHFGPNVNNSFDFKAYDPIKRIINLDFDSEKTRNTLNKIAKDLIEKCKNILSL